MKNVIFDLYGTLANCDHRRHHVEGNRKDWDAFFDECDRDAVIEHVARLFRFYRDSPDRKVYILSGRMGNVNTRAKTVDWLKCNDLWPEYDRFLMRSDGDYRSDVEVKREMIDALRITPENTECVFDDRNCMVNAWRLWGFNCFQVAEGDF